MAQLPKLAGFPNEGSASGMYRINRLPIIVLIVIVVTCLLFYGLASQLLYFQSEPGIDEG
ncbi:MAG TPA: hypothetical protein VGV39_02125 [Mesorhizobium sp.]|jgi:type IV secretion system protein VirB10|uniref:hypothetical protein n=1 Tax=Mesorhizobium sp. TaxID=1871066 RepID=UPI002DDCFD85|nr:hypothetical protein [Mesorhizobium sp.]HEV2501840.1 hypothetical protein [Mesorhizobium sp.]